MKIIVVNGYAESGKSTTIKYLNSKYNYSVYSTSAYLHETAARILHLQRPKVSIEEYKELLQDKNGVIIFGSQEYEVREFLIKLAEGVLVPVYSRKLFAYAVIWNLLREKPEYAVIESIGGEEWEIMKQELDNHDLSYEVIVLRSFREKQGVDIRKLIKEGTVIENNSTLINDLYHKIDRYLISANKNLSEAYKAFRFV